MALNSQRAAEEVAGTVRWLRPEFQNPDAVHPSTSSRQTESLGLETTTAAPITSDGKQPWPGELPAQMATIAQVLTASNTPLSLDDIAARFSAKGAWKKRLPQLLDTLAAVGRARQTDGNWSST